ncbi:MAG: VOC family protein [Actinomycetota bacterium]
MYAIDHVVLAVTDLAEAGERLRRVHGLASVPGGVHPRWGTGNRIVPLGEEYLELITVMDRGVARANALGRALLEVTADASERWFAVCLSDTDLDATASRLGLEVKAGARTRPDGSELRWRSAGIDDEDREPWLPFFIEWIVPAELDPTRLHPAELHPAELHPGRTPIEHEVEVSGIAGIEIAGEVGRFREWLGPSGDELPIRVVDGAPSVRAVEVGVVGGEPIRLV